MPVMFAELLKQFRALPWTFNPPASDDDIAHMAAELKCPIDETLAAIYRDHNGTQPHPDNMFMFRLMSVDEVIETYHMNREFQEAEPHRAFPPELRFFWTDDESNYATLYTAGPLAGKISYYDHEDPDFAPRFRSVVSYYWHSMDFLASITDRENGPGFYNMPTDYPLRYFAPEESANLALALDFLARYQAITDKSRKTRRDQLFYGFTAINLLPFSESARLLPLTYAACDEDMWIQAHSCELLGKRRYLPAIRRLAEVARDGRHNGKGAALRALGYMRTPEAKAALLALEAYFADGWRLTWEWAMRDVDLP